MRALPLFGALLLGLCACGTAAAQNTSNLYQSNYASSSKTTALFQGSYGTSIGNAQNAPPNTSLGVLALSNGFSPRTLFTRFQSPPPRPGFQPLPTLPDPTTNPGAYLNAFGIRPLR